MKKIFKQGLSWMLAVALLVSPLQALAVETTEDVVTEVSLDTLSQAVEEETALTEEAEEVISQAVEEAALTEDAEEVIPQAVEEAVSEDTDMETTALPVIYSYEKVAVESPVANSWQAGSSSTDGGPAWAFNGETGNWWHMNYSTTDGDNLATSEFTNGTVTEIPAFSEIGNDTIGKRAYIGGKFEKAVNLGKMVYKGRTSGNQNYIGQWALYTANVAAGEPTAADFSTIAATGTFTSNAGGTITFEPVTATHFRLVVFSFASWATASAIEMYDAIETEPKVAPHDYSPNGTTKGQPFAEGTGGSHNFRIPCITTVTLPDGTERIIAAADMRWNHDLDGRAIDLIVSYSDDKGANWTYNSPLYFNDSEDPQPSAADGSYNRADADEFNYASTIMDPVIVADKDGNLYVLADLFPGGVAIENAVPLKPGSTTGYENVNGTERLVLYASPQPGNQSDINYTHYVGDYVEDWAPVVNVSTGETEYYIDREFDLFDENKEPKYCMQIGTEDTIVRQNIFYYNADLHVRCATYLVVMKSTDYGQTWSKPLLINNQVNKDEFFYGAGPGTGMAMENGMIIFPMYSHVSGVERSSLIFSTDGGNTWTRTGNSTGNERSSESVLVKISETRLRQFMRGDFGQLSYVDWNWNEEQGTWVTTQKVTTLNQVIKSNNQLSAIKLEQTYQGKPVIVVSTASGSTSGTEFNDVRADGRFYTYAVNDDADNTMSFLTELDVWPMGSEYPGGLDYDTVGGKECYTYSSLTQLEDGDIALLVETDFRPAKMTYRVLDLEEACPFVIFDDGDTLGRMEARSVSNTAELSADCLVVDDIDTTPLTGSGDNGTNYFIYEGAVDNTDETPGVDGWAWDYAGTTVNVAESVTRHYVNAADNAAAQSYSYTLKFKGTGVDILGHKGASVLNVQLDNGIVMPITIAGEAGAEVILCRITDLEDAEHTVKVTLPTGNDTSLEVTGARVYAEDYSVEKETRVVETVSFKNKQTEAKEVNSFIFSADSHWSGNDKHLWSTAPTAAGSPWYEVDFAGSQIDVYAGKNTPHGDVIYTIYERDDLDTNGTTGATPVKGPVKVSLWRSSNIDSMRTWTFKGLDEGKVYTLRAEAAFTGQGSNKIIDCANVVVYHEPYVVDEFGVPNVLDVKEGQTAQIAYTIKPSHAKVEDIVFTSANTNIATVSDTGVVTGVKDGTTTITMTSASCEFVNAQITVTVENVTPVMKGMIGDPGLQWTEEDRASVKEQADGGNAKTQETLTAWKNDKAVSALVLISDESALRNVTVTADALKHSNGKNIIRKNNVVATFIKSTKAYNGGFLGYGLSQTQANFPAVTETNRSESADILFTTEPTNIGWNELQAVWMEFNIPKDATPGTYTTNVTVTADELQAPLTFTYEIEVKDAVLPDVTEYYKEFSIDFWHHPYASADYYGVEPFSEEHFTALKSVMDLYKQIGGNTIYATMVEESWNAQTYSPYGRNNPERSTYPSMIKWISTDNGETFTYDYTDFDKWIEFNKANGLGDEIALFSIAPWPRTFRWYNGTGEDATIVIGGSNYYINGVDAYQRVWTDFLTKLFAHLEEKGWIDDTYIAIDEQGFEQRAFNIVEAVEESTGLQVKMMGFIDGIGDTTKRNLSKKLDYASLGDFAVQQNLEIFNTLLEERNANGQKTVIYSCTEHRPGQFSLSQPVEGYWAVANAGKQGATGFSRWAWDAWGEDPLEDATTFAFEPGDCFVMYPDVKENGVNGTAKSSVRLEMMAQAVRDMNKVHVMMNSQVGSALTSYQQQLYDTIDFTAYKNTAAVYLNESQIAQVQSDVTGFKAALDAMTDEYIALGKMAKVDYNIQFDTQGGEPLAAMKVAGGSTVELPMPVKDGYIFKGWYTDAECNGAEFTENTAVTKDIVLYAKWVEVLAAFPTEAYAVDTSGEIEKNGIYVLTFYFKNNNEYRVMEGFAEARTTAAFSGYINDGKYSLATVTAAKQTWQAVPYGNGFALKSMTSTDSASYYLDLSAANTSGVTLSTTPHELVITSVNKDAGTYHIASATTDYKIGKGGNNNASFQSSTTATDICLIKRELIPAKSIAPHDYSPSGTTVEQPFAEGTGGSHNFRIPCMVTLSDGRIVAAADMRWNHDLDGRAIDLIASYSDDNGATWTFNSPMYMNDSEDPQPSAADGSYNRNDANEFNYAATIMDPVMLVDNDDNLYILADLFPGGVAIENAVPLKPEASTGYETIDGVDRLVLYASPDPANQDDTNYTHYIGDFEEDGFAAVYDRVSKRITNYIDREFDLFDRTKRPTYCVQIGTEDTLVRQNIFYYNADLHVRCATYLVVVKSTDRGETWSKPMLINNQVNKENKNTFYGVGPGTGITMANGMLIFPMYQYPAQYSSLIFSTDGGETWKRTMNTTSSEWSSESVLVKLSETKLRQFIRSGNSVLSYVDWNWDEEQGTWITNQIPTKLTQAVKDNNQLSALKLSKTVNGKEVIVVSTATSSSSQDVRADGRIYTYVLNDDDTMTLLSEFDVWPQGSQYPHGVEYSDGKECYTYSSMTETKDGKLALLVETDFKPAKMTYRLLTLTEACPSVTFDESTVCTVSFNDTDGTVIASRNVVAGKTVIKPKNPVKEGYRFVAWMAGEEEFDFTKAVTESITLTAKWEAVDKAKLQALVEVNQERKESSYTEETWTVFVEKLTNAKAVLSNHDASQEMIDTAKAELTAAVESLVKTAAKLRTEGALEVPYDGTKKTLDLKVYDGTVLLKEGTDYSISYKNNVNAYPYGEEDEGFFNKKNAPKAIIKMKGNYKDSKEVYFKILPLEVAGNVVVDNLSATYTGNEQKIKPAVIWNGKTLKADKDYKVIYTEDKEIKDVGTYPITIMGKGNFGGTLEKEFLIAKSEQIAMSQVKVAKIKTQNWVDGGVELDFANIKVTYKGKTLSEDEYEVEYQNNETVGTAYAILTGMEEDFNNDGYSFEGSKIVSFKITGTAMSKVKVENTLSKYDFTGEQIKPLELLGKEDDEVEVTCKRKDESGETVEYTLVEGPDSDYTVTYQKNINKGTATMLLTGNPERGFTGTKKVNFKIDAQEITDLTVELEDGTDVQYMKGGAKPKVILINELTGERLVEGTDYTLSYKKNKNVGTASLRVKGKGNYKGSTQDIPFEIHKKDLTEENGITVVINDKVVNTGKEDKWKQNFKVYDADGKALSANKDYIKAATYELIQDENGTELSEPIELKGGEKVYPNSVIRVTVRGLNNYADTADVSYVECTYRILAAGYDISKATIKINAQQYTGSEIVIDEQIDFKDCFIKNKGQKTPLYLVPTIDEDGNLQQPNIEIVDCVNNIKKGTAKVTFRGINGFGGTKTVTFKIEQRSAKTNWVENLVTAAWGLFH